MPAKGSGLRFGSSIWEPAAALSVIEPTLSVESQVDFYNSFIRRDADNELNLPCAISKPLHAAHQLALWASVVICLWKAVYNKVVLMTMTNCMSASCHVHMGWGYSSVDDIPFPFHLLIPLYSTPQHFFSSLLPVIISSVAPHSNHNHVMCILPPDFLVLLVQYHLPSHPRRALTLAQTFRTILGTPLLYHLYRQIIPLIPHLRPNLASHRGNTQILTFWKEQNMLDTHAYTHCAVNWASQANHTQVLDWWRENLPPHEWKYSVYAINGASAHGCIESLEWWKRNKKDAMRYTEDAINHASGNGHVHILEWWKNSGLELKYTEHAMDKASTEGHVNILRWWRDSGLVTLYTKRSVDQSSMNGHVEVLQFWYEWKQQEMMYSSMAIMSAAHTGQLNVLEWWKSKPIQLKLGSASAPGSTSTNTEIRLICKQLLNIARATKSIT